MNSKINAIITELAKQPNLAPEAIHRIFINNVEDGGKLYSKSEILEAYNDAESLQDEVQQQNFLSNITMKKIRTLSGVTTVTVLTKPFACPGKCIFCPNDVRMPKSYISSEPGAQRAAANRFDPYAQTYNRLLALEKIGHPTDKVELIVLGGTWTAYPESYQIWFIKRCFDALNDFRDADAAKSPYEAYKDESQAYETIDEVKNDNGVTNYNLSVSLYNQTREAATWEELELAQLTNETSDTRCVGLVIETRPDEITQLEVIRIRRLGATKVQLGVQSLSDRVLKANKRGHNSKQTALAFKLLREAGFKIHVHYMPNLYGSTTKSDKKDFQKLFKDISYRPDELKLYPCSLIEGTELMNLYRQGLWKPYTSEELLDVLSSNLKNVPRYCRVTRMIRDIPSQEIVDGNKITNFRQTVESYLESQKIKIKEIRKREIKDEVLDPSLLILKKTSYKTKNSVEYFLEYCTKDDRIAGFLRLSLPKQPNFLSELSNAAIIREVHVYGASLQIGDSLKNAAQHKGLGTKLIEHALKLAKTSDYRHVAVISSVGTRKYYEKFGFVQKNLYQLIDLDSK